MLVPYPNFAHIVIHRLKNDSGEPEDIKVDLPELQKSAPDTNLNGTPEKNRADVSLEWGDVVEIPALRFMNEKAWESLDPNTLHKIRGALRRDAEVVLPNNAGGNAAWVPPIRAFSWNGQRPSPSNTPVTDLFSPTIAQQLQNLGVDLDKISHVEIRSGDRTREIRTEDLLKNNSIWDDGDVIVPVLR